MAVIQKGTVENALQPGVGWSPKGGRFEEARIQILHTSLAGWEVTLRAYGYEYRYEPIGNSPMGILSYKRPQETQPDEILSDVWSLRPIEEQRTVWADELVVAQLATLASDQLRARYKADIENMLRGQRNAEVEYADGTTTEGYALTVANIVTQAGPTDVEDFTEMTNALVKDLTVGADTQFVSTWALLRTMVLPAGTSLEPVFAYNNRAFPTPLLLAYETTIPTNLAAGITANLASKYWFAKSSTAEQQDDGRWRYTREYWCVDAVAALQQDRIVTSI